MRSILEILRYIKMELWSNLQEEMDMKVLQFQNKKLTERIEQRRKAEDELRKRIDQLEQRQTTDDAVLCIVNRYWNQVWDHGWGCLIHLLVACSAPSHYLNQCWLIVNWTPGNIFQWNLNQNSIIFIQENTVENVICQSGGHFVQGWMS